MKKMMMTMIAAVLMSSAAFAQEEKKCECKCKQPDKTEMVKHRTDRVVKKYGLNDQQAASLLELNTKMPLLELPLPSLVATRSALSSPRSRRLNSRLAVRKWRPIARPTRQN